jgi:hypothetical protein
MPFDHHGVCRLSHRIRQLSAVWLLAASQIDAQVSRRDSAGVVIVTSTAPTNQARAVAMPETPRLLIGTDSAARFQFRSIRRVAVLSDGRILVVDGASRELRYFDRDGTKLLHRVTPAPVFGQPMRMSLVRRTTGDTVAVSTGTIAVVRFDGNGTQIDSAPTTPPSGPPRDFVIEILQTGHLLLAGLVAPEERAVGQRWVATAPLRLRTAGSPTVVELGAHAMAEIEQIQSGAAPRWLAPIAAVAASPTRVFLGYGAAYEIRAYAHDGTLRSIIRRAWTPVPITDAEWETWVVEWSKNWIQSTGPQRVRDVQTIRESPWADSLPAFSQFLVDRTGRLWVRDAHWQDAIAAGSLNDMAVVPSTWSVFGETGEWLYDVTMPPYFEPSEIGTDYVAGKLIRDGRELAAVFGLVPAKR